MLGFHTKVKTPDNVDCTAHSSVVLEQIAWFHTCVHLIIQTSRLETQPGCGDLG